MATKKQNGTETSAFGTNGRVNHVSSKFYNSKLYSELGEKKIVDKNENDFPDKLENTIILGSAENMKELPDNSVHLIITSPPYNVSKEYDEDLSLKEYLQLLKNAFNETYRVLVNGGRACINVANLGRKPYIPLSDYISKMMLDIGFNMRGEIIWNKAASASPSTTWGSWQSAANPILRDVHEYILVFSKGDYKRERWQKENTITKEQFMGSGTTTVSALKSDRKFVGYDISQEYIDLAEKRVFPYKNQIKFEFEPTTQETEPQTANTGTTSGGLNVVCEVLSPRIDII